jgi:hypothetical protein
VLERRLEHQAVREVVDVFRRAAEVHLNRVLGQADGVQLLAQVVLDGFHVVLDLDLVGLDLGRLELVEVFDPAAQRGDLLGAQRRHVRHLGAGGHEHEPLDLDLHAVLEQAILGGVSGEGPHHRGVTLVERAHDAGRGRGGADEVFR